jgi:photolyase PhrII
MRTAVRDHDNPALDVAILAAASLGVPFFVYHALSERYPYASDRHHRFILEGARVAAQALTSRGIGYAFHLERPGHRGTILHELASEAALVVTEDMPVAPLMGWTESIAEHAPVWAVDTACLAPMRSVPRASTTRAFRFREATRVARRPWLSEPWPVAPAPGDGWVPELPFEPVDLAGDELEVLIAACDIDHSIGPVPHTPGGSNAGYARWDAFRRGGLRAYARRRNDPLRGGVSRMSAYLHYGHVSPFRLAREAAVSGGKGGEKYLDELLVWRELAYALCAHHPQHGTAAALPAWARDTLAENAQDPREELSWERLARGRTGDALWDAAQRSLLIHGELHNNVRMTWGKALLGWTRNVEQALERLVDLNHRYALDGRDPASFGGLLWCLGQFDRPFEPPQPIVGTVRPRSTAQHARRLDVDEYGRRTRRPAWSSPPRVGIVGAGLAGLMAGRVLQDHGLEVVLFDKGRRPGGRANTREHGQFRFDHGAQFLTARHPVVQRYVASWVQEGVVAEWVGTLVRMGGEGVEPANAATRYVGVPGMIALAGHLAGELDVRAGVRITQVQRTGDSWTLVDEDGRVGGAFDQAVIAVPAAQAAPLLTAAPRLREAALGVEMAPCWAGMFVFDRSLDLGFDGAFVADGPISWLARDASKPGRPSAETWVVHAGPAWTRAHADTPRERAAGLLLHEVRHRFGPLPEPVFERAHRWGYALASEPVGSGALYEADLEIGACGDWCRGGRVEGALLSGIAMAGRILGQAPPAPADPLALPSEPEDLLSLGLG